MDMGIGIFLLIRVPFQAYETDIARIWDQKLDFKYFSRCPQATDWGYLGRLQDHPRGPLVHNILKVDVGSTGQWGNGFERRLLTNLSL
jgi:hypothetical protein